MSLGMIGEDMRHFLQALLAVLSFVPGNATILAATDPPLRLSQKILLPGVEGRIDHLAVDMAGQRLFVAALGNYTLEVLDLKAGKQVRSITGLHEPQGIAYVTASDRLVVASGADGSCRVYDARSFGQVHAFDLKEDADNVRYDPSTQRIYVGYGAGALGVIDLARGTRIADIPLEGHPESFQLETRGKRIFVNVPTARQIVVIDREKNSLLAAWLLEKEQANFPMALDEGNHRLLVGCRRPARLVVVDTETGKVVSSVPCAGDADDLFYDVRRKRIYVSGGEGFVSVFQQMDADRYELVHRLPTAAGARTSLFVPPTGHFYLAVPHRGSQPAEGWVYRASGGGAD
jgi:DNA-binding beta-propeller fold protein YncE